MPNRTRTILYLPGVIFTAGILLLIFGLTARSRLGERILAADVVLLLSAFTFLALNAYRRVDLGHRRLEQSLSELVRHIKDYAIFLVDRNGHVMTWNSGAQQMKGYTEDEVLGKPISIFYTDEDAIRGEPLENLKKAARNGRYESIGLRKRKDGTLFHADVVFTPLYDDNDRLIAFIKITRDITEQKRQEEEMKASLIREREVSQMKSRFVTLASHEFKTPLSVILSSVSLIERYSGSHEQENRLKHIHRIKNNVNNLKQILNEFLSLERLEGNMVQNCPVQTDLIPLLQEVIHDMEGGLKEGQRIILKTEGDPLSLAVDRQLLRNILNNLLSNAIKYSPENSPIRCTVSFFDNHVEIAVKDEGIGIPLQEQHHLFERFFRASNAVGIPGTGLGLSIVQKYLELMGGKITMESAPGKGCTFIISLPRQVSLTFSQVPA